MSSKAVGPTDDFNGLFDEPETAGTSDKDLIEWAISEAPGSINSYFITPNGSNVQLTIRAASWHEAMDLFEEAETSAIQERGWTPKPVGQQWTGATSAGPSKTSDADRIREDALAAGKAAAVPSNGSSKGTPAPVSPGGPQDGGTEGSTELVNGRRVQVAGEMWIEWFTTTPKPDGKTTVEFWRPNREWPELTSTFEPDRWVDVFKGTAKWLIDHFKTAAKYDFPVVIRWVAARNQDGSLKLNQRGNPYKNIASVTLPPKKTTATTAAGSADKEEDYPF